MRKKKARVHMLDYPFEDNNLEIPEDDYNLIITSPPYFNLEEYNGGDQNLQSTVRYPKLHIWLKKFLFPMLKKAWDHLVPGGHMAIIINDSPYFKYVEDMLEFAANNLKNCTYRGCIAYAEDKSTPKRKKFGSPQPIWIWKKN